MAWDPLFDMVKCPVDHVDKVDMQFISDCLIRPAPDPIYDCPDLVIPQETPPPPTPPCPVITCGTSDSSGTSMPANIDVTLVCPSESARADVTVLFDCFTAQAVIVSSNSSTTTCDITLDFVFDFDFQLEIPLAPCPNIAGSAVANRGEVDLLITRTGGSCVSGSLTPCDFQFDFDFTVPAAICPDITGSATISGAGPDATVDLIVTASVDLSTCAYLFDFDFFLPQLCDPVASAGLITVTPISCSDPPSAAMNIDLFVNDSECIYTFNFDFWLPEACEVDKYAIVPYPHAPGVPTHLRDPDEPDYLGLVCVEGPEVRFEDVMSLAIPPYTAETRVPIDPLFLGVCEPNSVQVVSVASSLPVAIGARIENGDVILTQNEYNVDHEVSVNVKVSGIRRGRNGIRFPRFTQAEYAKNTEFWGKWNK